VSKQFFHARVIFVTCCVWKPWDDGTWDGFNTSTNFTSKSTYQSTETEIFFPLNELLAPNAIQISIEFKCHRLYTKQ
jgi:hypothetical protein